MIEVNKTATIAAIIVVIVVTGSILHIYSGGTAVKVFHAGSLSKPFQKMDEENDEFVLRREPSGSVKVRRKITELGKKPDIAAVSDYSIIQDRLIPQFTDWYVLFARNEIVIAYTEESAYSDEINENNWFKILGRPDVKFAFGDPNSDPGGYRAMMAVQLAEMYYDNSEIFDHLIANQTAMSAPTFVSGAYTIEAVPLGDLNPSDKIRVGSMEVAVIPALVRGSVDYMFNYRSIAAQHGFEFVELPDEINLSKKEYAENYEMVKVKLADGTVKTGKPIVYGVTMLKNAEHEQDAIRFLRYLLSDDARAILRDMGQPPIDPPVANDLDNVPQEIRDLVTEYED